MIQNELSVILDKMDSSDEFSVFKKQVLSDYWLALVSREASMLARKEVLNGKSKFGVTGDGKELAQIAMAKAFQPGDWRSGYYRDQTLVMALGIASVEEYFAQLYADCDNDPFSGGRQMNCHFSTGNTNENGEWIDTMGRFNTTSDISCTAGQMGRALGIAMASSLYRKLDLDNVEKFTNHGNEVSFCTIGDASTSEGAFFETINAAAVMNVPLVVAIWDDGYGISVPVELQTVKASISKALEGFIINEENDGIYIFTAKAWDYQELCSVFEEATRLARKYHKTAIVHVQEVTQPQGHSSSGSHERYKSDARLEWEKQNDCNRKMAEWLVSNAFATDEELEELNREAKLYAKKCKQIAWEKYRIPIDAEITEFRSLVKSIVVGNDNIPELKELDKKLYHDQYPALSDMLQVGRRMQVLLKAHQIKIDGLDQYIISSKSRGKERYNSKLHSDTPYAAVSIPEIKAVYAEDSEFKNGYEIINKYFDYAFSKHQNLIAFGEDVGKIGDVNQGFAALQDKHGDVRIFDSGIREWAIVGQAIGSAIRGLIPIAEIQYIDYLIYALSPLSDDLASLRFRSNGKFKAPVIIRSRGHRLEGIWHAGSPMGVIITALKGIYLCVPRNMVQAAGMYNTLMQSDDPGIVIECLNGYRLKEKVPQNLGEFTVPLGRPEVLKQGQHITIVTYGSCVRIVMEALPYLDAINIDAEVIDVQTLMPFDLEGVIGESIKKTSRILFVDEDVPGGASSYMMSEVIDKQNGFKYLDAKPVCLSAQPNRTPFGTDGDYFTKPNPEDVIEAVIKIVSE
jgi:pyruvate/2-oxoglutarate/acetoin dehydrogenase E1 component/TPP-dependent pyruvate/acetoin dehydrogenase alpha subunit